MDDAERLYIELDFWDDAVGAFEPAKVLRQLELAFPDSDIDPTDHQRVRLLRELEFWAQQTAAEQREELVGQTYRFIIPFPSGHRVSGCARRLSDGFQVPVGLPPECRERLLSFLRSLRMGAKGYDEGRWFLACGLVGVVVLAFRPATPRRAGGGPWHSGPVRCCRASNSPCSRPRVPGARGRPVSRIRCSR